MNKCLLCKKETDVTAYSICYDPEYEVNVWGGDSHDYLGFLCNKCGKRFRK